MALFGSDLREALKKAASRGFVLVRISGSHHRLQHPTDPARTTTVPIHAANTLKRGTLRNIIKQAGLTVDEFLDLL